MNDPQSGSPPRALTPTFWLVAAALTAGAWVEGQRVRSQELTQRKLEQLAESSRSDELTDRLTTEFDALFEQVSYVRLELKQAAERVEAVGEGTNVRLAATEDRIGQVGQAIEAQASQLTELDRRQAHTSTAWERELEDREARLSDEYSTIHAQLIDTRAAVQRERETWRDELARLDERLPGARDLAGMWDDLMGPVVMLAGDSSVGSGVLLASELQPDERGHRTYLLTAWHVVRDIRTDASPGVPVTLYEPDGSTSLSEAELLAKNPELDAALLVLHSAQPLRRGAALASRSRLEELRVFDQIYAVGCPLGNDPIPTFGEVANGAHEVDGQRYWMINAPSYIGNSGGGIFDAETHELLGIFSKIYTHGTLRPTIVPHMGLVTPLTAVYDWLESEGYDLAPMARGTTVAASSE